MPPAVPDRDQDDEDPGVESGEYTGRTRLNKRKADCISRSQYEVYLFQFSGDAHCSVNLKWLGVSLVCPCNNEFILKFHSKNQFIMTY